MYRYRYMYMYVCIYIYIYIHTHTCTRIVCFMLCLLASFAGRSPPSIYQSINLSIYIYIYSLRHEREEEEGHTGLVSLGCGLMGSTLMGSLQKYYF